MNDPSHYLGSMLVQVQTVWEQPGAGWIPSGDSAERKLKCLNCVAWPVITGSSCCYLNVGARGISQKIPEGISEQTCFFTQIVSRAINLTQCGRKSNVWGRKASFFLLDGVELHKTRTNVLQQAEWFRLTCTTLRQVWKVHEHGYQH